MLSKTDLWIVPPSQHSAWFAQLDWYLNFQMCKGMAHQPAVPDAHVFRLAHEYGVKVEESPLPAGAPLLIACKNLAPAAHCLVLPFNGDLKNWMVEAKTIAFKMKCESVEVFLPAGVDASKAEKIWTGLNGECRAVFTDDNGVTI